MKNESDSQDLCKRGCGFYGSVQFRHMCSKCYQEQLKNETSNTQTAPISTVNLSHSSCAALASRLDHPGSSVQLNGATVLSTAGVAMRTGSSTASARHVSRCLKRKADLSSPVSLESLQSSSYQQPASHVGRCSWCRKRIGLTGFSCRCSGTFCSLHRYSDQHECSFDYQAHGRIELTKANPEVRCPKIRKL